MAQHLDGLSYKTSDKIVLLAFIVLIPDNS